MLHVDETEVTLHSGKGYVWVFTNLEEVVFMYRPTREGDFLKELLKDFRGVLVSDFYAPYDSNARAWYEKYVKQGMAVSHAIVNPPVDRNRASHEISDVFITVVEKAQSTFRYSRVANLPCAMLANTKRLSTRTCG